MDLVFTLNNGLWETEVQVTKDVNVHLEFNGVTGVLLYQKTAGENFTQVTDFTLNNRDIFDFDLFGLVYPKALKIVCYAEPVVAVLTEAA